LVLWDHRDQRAALAILVYQDKMERKDHRAEQEIKVLQAWLESLAWMECEVQKVTMESQDHQAMMDERAVLDRWVLQDLLEQWGKGRR
jgi:flavin reductase (DIM6/NTAB) family NADH-FMN oxidoreductase RutF